MFPVASEKSGKRGFPLVKWLLVLVNAWVFVHELRLPETEVEGFFLRWGAVPARLWARPESFSPTGIFRHLVPLVSYSFLHGGWLHIIGNLWALLVFGTDIERRFGHWRFLCFYFWTGVLAALAHCLLMPASRLPTVGASGAIAGVMGAYFLLFPFRQIICVIPIFFIPFFVRTPAILFFLVWLIFQFLGAYAALHGGGMGAGGVAFWAHVGGFAAGLVLAWRWSRR